MNEQAEGLLSAMHASAPARFATLAERWRADTSYLSSVQSIINNSSYQQIIGMGPQALPLILAELRDRPAFWFWALTAIAGEDPARGDPSFAKARSAWLKWGATHRLIAKVDNVTASDGEEK